jgi:hypothetical protein
VLLQNQGPRRILLQGYVLTDDLGLHSADPYVRGDRTFTFDSEVKLIPSAYVALVTGWGEDGWRRIADGSNVYQCYWCRDRSVWEGCDEPIHLLSIVNTYSPRPTAYVIRR